MDVGPGFSKCCQQRYGPGILLQIPASSAGVEPPAQDDISVINQRKASKQRRAQKRQLDGDEEDDTVVRKKQKDPP